MRNGGSNHWTWYRNGRVLTQHGGRITSSLLVRGGVVAAAGDEQTIAGVLGDAEPEVVDLDGAVVLPGLIDGHPHMTHFGMIEQPLIDCYDATDHADIVSRIATAAARTPPGEWIVTTPIGEPHFFLRRSWRDLAEGELPDAAVLDRATTEHPVAIAAFPPTTPNTMVLNSAGLREAGIGRGTRGGGNVTIEQDPAGAPTGRLHGAVNAYFNDDPFFAELGIPVLGAPGSDPVAGVMKGFADHHRLGVTTAYEAHGQLLGDLDVLEEVRRRHGLSMRTQFTVDVPPGTPPEDVDAFLDTVVARTNIVDDRFRVHGITICQGGPMVPGAILMRDPYPDPWGGTTTGQAFLEVETMRRALRGAVERDLRVSITSIGLAEHDTILDLLEELAAEVDLTSRHWVLEHGYFIEPEQIRRYARLGFCMTAMPLWGDIDAAIRLFGPRILDDTMPLRRFLDAGMTVALASDWGPKNLFELMWCAVTGAYASGGFNDGPGQLVSRQEALDMFTTHGSTVLEWPGIGRLAPGHHADLVVVDRDPVNCPLDELPKAQVLRTVVGGDVVHDTGEL